MEEEKWWSALENAYRHTSKLNDLVHIHNIVSSMPGRIFIKYHDAHLNHNKFIFLLLFYWVYSDSHTQNSHTQLYYNRH